MSSIFRRFLKMLPILCAGIFALLQAEPGRYWEWQTKYQQESVASTASWTQESLSGTLIVAPDTMSDRLLSLVRTTQHRLWISVYILTDKGLISEIQKAFARGVDVRLILEPNVFGAPNINKKTFLELQKAHIPMSWSDPKKFAFTHTKYILADDRFWIGTANFSHAALQKNREFSFLGDEKEISLFLSGMFVADAAHEPFGQTIPQNLVISPINARQQLENLLLSAKKEVAIYAETFSDDHILEILQALVQKKIRVRILLGDTKKIPQNTLAVRALTQRGIAVQTPKKPIIHAKAILIDGERSYIGSQNFSQNSLERNREVGILLGPKETQELKKIFEQDFQ